MREQEQGLLNQHVPIDGPVKVLDLGCGIGRHLKFIRQRCAQAELFGTEKESELRDYCQENVCGSVLADFTEVSESEFDLVLLMGAGLGIFGEEQNCREGLKQVFAKLNRGGVLLAEGGPLAPGKEYDAPEFVIRYEDVSDPPFRWGYCSREWIRGVLEQIGFEVEIINSTHRSGMFYICVAKKPV